jgi:hypothetical protein
MTVDLKAMADGSRKSVADLVFGPLLATLSDEQVVSEFDRYAEHDTGAEVLFHAAFCELWAQLLRAEIAKRGR